MTLAFGSETLDYKAGTSHFAYIGATGSGKTVLIRLLMQSVLFTAATRNISTRLLVYDSKREMMPILHGIFNNLERQDAARKIKLINPLDKRGVAWNMAEDITEPVHAQELASILVPDEPNTKEPFYPNAARLIIESVILSFITESPRQWTFRDVCLAVETQATIEQVLCRPSPAHTSWVPKALFGDDRTTANILATLAAAMRPYRIIAALWDKAKERISLHEWLRSHDQILVLGNSPTSRTAIDAINQVIFKRLSQIILEEQPEIKPEGDLQRVWIFLDEFVRAGRLNGAVELATEGRSKGVCFVTGFQDINGLRAVYGREVGEEIIGQCTNIALLRMQSPDSAEWASTLIGDYRGVDEIVNRSVNHGDGGMQTSFNYQFAERRSVLASHFRQLPPVRKPSERDKRDEGQGIHGVFYSPFLSADTVNEWHIEYDWLFSEGNLWDKDETIKGYERVTETKHQYLEQWGPRDFVKLKLSPGEKKKEPEPRTKDDGGDSIKDAFRQQGFEIDE